MCGGVDVKFNLCPKSFRTNCIANITVVGKQKICVCHNAAIIDQSENSCKLGYTNWQMGIRKVIASLLIPFHISQGTADSKNVLLLEAWETGYRNIENVKRSIWRLSVI